jgi:hypothetical protein
MSAFPTVNANPRSSRTQRRLACRRGTTTTSTLYECPAGYAATVASVWIANTTGSAITVRIHHLIPRETAAEENALFYGLSCAANTTTIVEVPIYLGSGEKLSIYASSSTAGTFTVYGTEYQVN